MRSPLHSLAAALFAAAVCTPLAAQGRLVALVNDPLTFAPSEVVLTPPGQCGVNARCVPAGFPAAVAPLAGGTAHDPRTGGTWITNGSILAKVEPDGCSYQCGPMPLVLPVNAFITGLAFYETQNTLLMVDSLGGLTRVEVGIGCQFGQFDRCQITTPLPVLQTFAGLAIDEVSGLVFYSAVSPIQPALSQRIYVARFADPCNPICNVDLFACPTVPIDPGFGSITGLAFDPCERRIYATDGDSVIHARFTRTADGACILEDRQCCAPTAATQRLRGAIGLCIRPVGGREIGSSCANGLCAPCGNSSLRPIGDASIGNANFGFQLSNAPVGSLAFLGINAGSCQTPGVTVPPLCGAINLPFFPLAPIFVGPQVTMSTSVLPCTGRARFGVSIPLNVALCGDVYSFQSIMLCNNAPNFGTAITACFEVAIGGT